MSKPSIQRVILQTQILETLGAPIIAAVSDVARRKSPENDNNENLHMEAEQTASLLTKAVQVSLALSDAIGIKDSSSEEDSARLALTALAASLVAAHYRQTGEAPDDDNIKRLIKALEAVLAFSDNFTVSDEANMRLERLSSGYIQPDNAQMSIQFTNLLIPVVNAVTNFSFGQPEQKLVSDITERLFQKMGELYASLPVEQASDAEKRNAELALLKGLVEIYIQCHKDEMASLEQDRAQENISKTAIDSIWKSFETRVGMVAILSQATAEHVGGGKFSVPPADTFSAEQPAAETSAPPPPREPIRTVAPIENIVPIDTTPPVEEVKKKEETPEEKPQDNASQSPMSFFKPGGEQTPEDDSGQADKEQAEG